MSGSLQKPEAAGVVTLFAEPCHAYHNWRMAIVKRGVEGMGMEIGEVFPREFHQRGGECVRRAAQLCCEPVGFPLVPAG